MARIAGVNIPNHQHTEIALTAIYGIGRTRAQKICDAAGVKRSAKIKDLSYDSQIHMIVGYEDLIMTVNEALLSLDKEKSAHAKLLFPSELGGFKTAKDEDYNGLRMLINKKVSR